MSQTVDAPSPTTRNPVRTTSKDSGAQPPAKSPSPKTVHVVLQGKGGIGKTLVASLVAQYLTETGRPPVCFDTDPVNGSFTAIKALKAESVKLLQDNALNVKGIDMLVEKILTAESDVVVDNGAASFVPFSDYLVENGISELIEGNGKSLVVHAIIVGSGNAIDTAKGLESVLTQFPSSVRVVVWINEYFGPAEVEGIRFEDTALYATYRERIAGIVHLRRQNPAFGDNITDMLSRRLTFAEALADPAFLTVPRQRLTMFRRDIWEQLGQIV